MSNDFLQFLGFCFLVFLFIGSIVGVIFIVDSVVRLLRYARRNNEEHADFEARLNVLEEITTAKRGRLK